MIDEPALADILLAIAPFAFLFKGVAFLMLAGVVLWQGGGSRTGRWLIVMFAATAVMSANLIDLMFYLDYLGDGEDIDTAREWRLVVFDAIWPVVTAVAATAVVVAQQRDLRDEVDGHDTEGTAPPSPEV